MLETPKGALNMRHLIRSIVQACSIRNYICIRVYFFLLCLFVSSFHVKPLSLKSDSETRTSYKFLGHFGPKGKLYILCFCCVTFTIFPDWLSSTSVGVLAGLQLHTFQAENVSSRTTCSHNTGEPSRNDLYYNIRYIYICKTRQRCNKGSVRYHVSLPCPCVEYDQINF